MGSICDMHNANRAAAVFGEDVIFFVDHGAKLCYPTPGSEGYPRESVHVA